MDSWTRYSNISMYMHCFYLEFHASCVYLELLCGIKQRNAENLTKILRNNFVKMSIFVEGNRLLQWSKCLLRCTVMSSNYNAPNALHPWTKLHIEAVMCAASIGCINAWKCKYDGCTSHYSLYLYNGILNRLMTHLQIRPLEVPFFKLYDKLRRNKQSPLCIKTYGSNIELNSTAQYVLPGPVSSNIDTLLYNGLCRLYHLMAAFELRKLQISCQINFNRTLGIHNDNLGCKKLIQCPLK